MRIVRLAAALMPAALLTGQVAFAQDAERRPRDDRAQAGSQAATSGGIEIPGPDGRAALRVVKDAPNEVRAGEEFQYRIEVRNVSGSPLVNVTVVEQVDGLEVRSAQTGDRGQPGGQGQPDRNQSGQQAGNQNAAQNQQPQGQQGGQGQSGQTQPGQTQPGQAQPGQAQPGQAQPGQGQQNQGQVQQQGNEIRYQVGRLEADEAKTLTVSAVANQPGDAHACMWVDFRPTVCTTIAVVQPDFRLVGRLLFERGIETRERVEGLYRCDQVSLEMEVTSTGDAATPPAQATVQLPQGLTTADGQQQLQVDLGPIEPGRTVERRVPLKLDPRQAQNEIRLPITATAGDLKANVTLPAVRMLNPQLRLAVDAPEQAYINRPVEMTVTVENPGQDPVLDAVVRVEGSSEAVRFGVSGAETGEGGAIRVGRLDGGQSKQFTVRMEAKQPAETTVNVVAEGYCVEAQRQQAKINLQGIPAVLIEVVDKVDPVPVGENTVYEIAVKNQGSERDTNLQLRATLAESMEFVRGDGETEVTAEGKTITFGPLEEIAPGGVVSWTLQVKANQADRARLKVELTSDATDEPIIEEEPTTLFGDSPQGQGGQEQGGQGS